MKNRRIRINGFLIITALTVIGCCVGLTARRVAIADSAKNVATPMPTLHGKAAFRHLEQTGLRNSLWAAVTAARYGVEPRKGGGYESANPGQKYRAIFTPQGVDVRGSSGTGGRWRLGMRLTAYGYGARKKAVIATGLKVAGERVEYERRSRDGAKLSEWYVNRAEGLEQGFTIPRAPGKRKAGEKLNLWLRLSGDLKARSADKGQAILLDGRGAGAGLRYDGMKAYDAIGRGLESRMKLSGDQVKIEVMDETAVYPAPIDPTLSQEAKLTAGDAASDDQFGAAVGISGETAVVGAPVDDTAAGPNAGSAYVFVRSGTGWSQQAKLTASDAAAGDIFGLSVAVTGDTVVVGASGDNMLAGSAYVFVRSGTSWSQQAKLTASDAATGDRFGDGVGISGDTVVVGASDAASDAGAAYVFVRSGTNWSQQAKLTASDAAVFDLFGRTLAVSGDMVVIGAPSDDTDAGREAGSAYVFVRSGTSWSQQAKLTASDAAPNDTFGLSVAVSGDTAVVGALDDDTDAGFDAGSAYVFVRSGTSWSQQAKLTASDASGGNLFGRAVAVSGNTAVVGAQFGNTAAGSAYVFVRSGTSWSQQAKLTASDAAAFDFFGAAVAISGDTVVVGALADDTAAGSNAGSAYVFVSADANTPPAITAASVSRTQGLPASIGAIAQVNDAEDALNTLNITVNGAASATAGGVTVSSISVDASGQVTASVGADCNASNASFTLRVADSGGLFAEATLNITVTPETIPPVIACPVNVVMTLPPNTMDTGMVVNYPAPTASDNCTASPIITTSQASGTVFPVGLTTVNVTATDAANNQATCSFTVTVRYNFSGFFHPVDNPPTVNVVNAGRAIPVKFSLSGDKGLNIFGPGYPASQQIACSDGAPVSEIEQTVTAGGSSLSYDAESDTYTYVWKTEESWAGTCRQLIVRLNDGSERVAFFKFR
jgi:hypothetical protein